MSIDHVGMTVSNYKQSKQFYTHILAPLGIKLITEHNNWAGFGKTAKPDFWFGQDNIIQPFTHIAFKADNIKAIDLFYDLAIREGAICRSEPAIRCNYYSDYYSAFIIDYDGHYIGATLHKKNCYVDKIE
jgi:catechol 2,3-dioxygenase-like lactoylglutathione lyase family enzyme